MWLRLGLAMHEPDIDRLKRRVSARQFMEWTNFYALDPWDSYRGDVRIAQLCSIVASGLSGKPVEMQRFMLFDKQAAKRGNVQDAKEMFRMIAARHAKST